MMKLSRSSAYGVQALLRIATACGQPITARELAAELGLPLDYLHKVLRRLVRAALLDSARGEQGGFRLARPADGITLLDVVEAVDGDLTADDSELRCRLSAGATEVIRKTLELASDQLCCTLQRVSLERLLTANSDVTAPASWAPHISASGRSAHSRDTASPFSVTPPASRH